MNGQIIIETSRGKEACRFDFLFAGLYISRITTDVSILLPGDLYAVKESDDLCTRYKVVKGACARSGISTREVNMDGANYWEHGTNVEACHAEAQRKRELAQARADEASARLADTLAKQKQAVRADRAARLLARIGKTITATFEDARAAGNCAAGIKAWAENRGVDVNGAVPIATLFRDSDRRAQSVALYVARKMVKAN